MVRPAMRTINNSEKTLKHIVAAFHSHTKIQVKPEIEALNFYLLNHAVADMTSKKGQLHALDAAELLLMDRYNSVLLSSGKRMLYYLLLICTRETRHEKTSRTSTWWKSMKKQYGPSFYDLHTTIKGTGSSTAVQTLLNTTPDINLGDYAHAMSQIFHTGSFNSAYGGAAWGAIADCLHCFITGQYSLETMLDTAFTLCHNNGPIFNKGILYENYTHAIYRILDIQRSGQIPHAVASDEIVISYVDSEVKESLHYAKLALGNDFCGGYIDWFKVEALGSKQSYPTEKKKQMSTHGNSDKSIKATTNILGVLEIMPNVYVEQVKSKR